MTSLSCSFGLFHKPWDITDETISFFIFFPFCLFTRTFSSRIAQGGCVQCLHDGAALVSRLHRSVTEAGRVLQLTDWLI